MKTRIFRLLVSSLTVMTAIGISGSAQAETCVGNCGTLGANGDVPAPPGGTTYRYVSTNGGVAGAGRIAGVGGTNGSSFLTSVFSANAGDPLNFNFNYVTSDGTGSFPDYGFAELLTDAGTSVGFLFTARTVVNPGNTSPGFGLPANISTLNPLTTAIQSGFTNWSPLGSYSGSCYQGVGNGCGSTGWIESTYNFTTAGNYQVLFGASNFGDTAYDSGLAFAGLSVAGTPIDDPVGAVPEPDTWAMMLAGFGMIGFGLRSRRKQSVRVTYA